MKMKTFFIAYIVLGRIVAALTPAAASTQVDSSQAEQDASKGPRTVLGFELRQRQLFMHGQLGS